MSTWGMGSSARRSPTTDILKSLNGQETTGASGVRRPCMERFTTGILRSFNGQETTDAPGTRRPATCNLAANNEHLEVLQWARSNGCPWNSLTCTKAVEGGHLEVLRW
ncbi:unnamed protein product, partial [Ectocarpus sp. 12 AP-2014]